MRVLVCCNYATIFKSNEFLVNFDGGLLSALGLRDRRLSKVRFPSGMIV